MKKVIFILIIVLLPLTLAAESTKNHKFAAGGGINFNLRYLYNEQGAFGAGGGGLFGWFRYQYKLFYVEAGAAWEISSIGMQVTFPLTAGGNFFNKNRISLDAYGTLYPGFALFRPRPPAMIGIGTGIAMRVKISKHFGFRFNLELRYMTCPEYSQKIAPYHTLEMPIVIALYGMW